jgi:hypothetical protein
MAVDTPKMEKNKRLSRIISGKFQTDDILREEVT